jgi:hypothetical protein
VIVWGLLHGSSALAQDTPPAAADVALDPARFGLDEVQDRTEIRFEDRTAYFGMLDHVRHVDPQALRRAAAEFVARRHKVADERLRKIPLEKFPVFADLFLHPEAYRGQPVMLQGHVIRVQKYSAANEYGLDPLYEAWLVADDSSHNPAAIIFTECPPELTVGEELVDGVSMVGYFLKLQIHEARDGKVRIAPLILARTLTVTPAGPAAELLPRPVKIASGIVLLALAAALALWLASGRRRPYELRAEIGDTSRPDFRGLEKLDRGEG